MYKTKGIFTSVGIYVLCLADYMWGLFPDVVMVIISEVAVDCVKHAFITKFNDIPADVRTKPIYTIILYCAPSYQLV